MFSPTVRGPVDLVLGQPAGDRALYWLMRAWARRSNSARSSGSTSQVMLPSPSYFEPWSSSLGRSRGDDRADPAEFRCVVGLGGRRNGGCEIAAGKTISFTGFGSRR